ncbi:MAG: potassium channel family protein [Candidatus Binatus sp.]|uniref:potassium channel family protein n=1 Tax=Candidatus Binatus sp. TaxID=2811406 RepID=UPI0027249857|nr:potassium channel family protein [Candidatus Binatus sp.]MDO8434358.1 potassium channel family protein [Candidatus Binatus sp.]
MNEPKTPGRLRSREQQLWFGLTHRNLPGRFTVLLFAILLLLCLAPVIQGHQLEQALMTVSLAAVLMSSLYALSLTRSFFAIGVLLVIPAFIGRIVLVFATTYTIEMISAGFSAAFLLYTVTALVSRLFTIKQVSLDMIAASICAYLMMGVGWGFIFAMIEMTHRGSFSAGLLNLDPSGKTVSIIGALHNFMYYSFVCLTTTGYGDIAPLSQGARVTSVMESVFGQLYIAILISRLVSLEVAQSMMKND